jgi:hypothetical protein
MSALEAASPEEHDPLELTSLDESSLFTALSAVDRVRPCPQFRDTVSSHLEREGGEEGGGFGLS